MPNAIVRANARTLPETTNRRTVLAAALAAGAMTALPASAAAQSALSDVDRQVLDLWEHRAELTAIATRLTDEHTEAYDQLPSWAQAGAACLRPDGSAAAAGMGAWSEWPIVTDLNRRPVYPSGLINARPGPRELIHEFMEALLERADDQTGVIEKYAMAFAELAERKRQQEAEKRRLGVDVLSSRVTAAWKAVDDAEKEFNRYLGASSVLALAAVLIIAIADEEIEGLNRAALAAIRPQLAGQIADDADRALAEDGENA